MVLLCRSYAPQSYSLTLQAAVSCRFSATCTVREANTRASLGVSGCYAYGITLEKVDLKHE